jgi:hypothetical protein
MKECPGVDGLCCEPIMDDDDYCFKCRKLLELRKKAFNVGDAYEDGRLL